MNQPQLPPRPIGSALLVATVRAAQYHRNRVALAVPPRNVQPPRNYQTPALAALEGIALALGAVAVLASAAACTVIAASIVGAL
jgi:hypothetical protein